MVEKKKFYDTDESKERFFSDVRRTAGYNESSDKVEFIKGAGVMYDLLASEVDRDLVEYLSRAEAAERQSSEARYDMTTLADLIQKYASM